MNDEKTDLLTKTKSLQMIVDNQTQVKLQLERYVHISFNTPQMRVLIAT